MTLFRREDWTLFRNLQTLGQKAGIPPEKIARLVVKELVDNALDEAGHCRFGWLDAGQTTALFVEDSSSGVPGTDAEIGELFSVSRPLTSSKLLRLPTRGALGNGLRVVSGAVLASGGELVVKTGGRALRLHPRDNDGGADVERLGPWDGDGTRVELTFGPALTIDERVFSWAELACRAAKGGKSYKGKTSAYWYDSDSFYELTQAAGTRTVRGLVECFDGCSGAKAGQVAADFLERTCESLTREEAERLLRTARNFSRPVEPRRLGRMGLADFGPGYAMAFGTFEVSPTRGKLSASIPFVVEAWVKSAHKAGITIFVNRTPITAEVWTGRFMSDRTTYGLGGCGLSSEKENTAVGFRVGRTHEFSLVVNVTTPYMPITTDGKEPDLLPIQGALESVLEKAVNRLRRQGHTSNGGRKSKRAVILHAIPAGVEKASGGGRYRFSLRQLFYAVRPIFLEVMRAEPSYNYFAQIVTDYEAELGHDLDGVYRDDRGSLYHPHLHEQIPLGTRSVESYTRPDWTFNKILYCEKEGFFPILIDAQWPERHDCALLTSKGFASRAARDVLDLLGKTDQELTFFCIHDADGAGTLIYESLRKATKARRARRVKIVNLGLEPCEGVAMGLPAEPVERKGGKTVPVAKYVKPKAREWLQRNRIELNAMDTPQFLQWLDAKMGAYSGKLIPPADVLRERLEESAEQALSAQLAQEALRAYGVEERLTVAMERLRPDFDRAGAGLADIVQADLTTDAAQWWTAPVDRAAEQIAGAAPIPTLKNGVRRANSEQA